nr:PREDICTED: uncharacterized protein LOC109041943 isoform X1 [Bemisia tabaci]
MQNDSTGGDCVRLGVSGYGGSVNSPGQHVAGDNNTDQQAKPNNCRSVSSSFGRPFTYLPNPINPANDVKPPQVPARQTVENKSKEQGSANFPPSLKTFTPQVQPIAPKPRPPVPPKRSECTRLSTVTPAPNQTKSETSEPEKSSADSNSKDQNGPSLLESSINSKIKTLKHVDPPVAKTILDFCEVTEKEIISNNINDGHESDKKEKSKNVVFENQLSGGVDENEAEKVEYKILNDKTPPKALQRTVFDVVAKDRVVVNEESDKKSPVDGKKDVITKDSDLKRKEPLSEVKKDYGTLDSIIRQNAQQIKQSCSINKNITNNNTNVITNNFIPKTSNYDTLPLNNKNEAQLRSDNNSISQNATRNNLNLHRTNSFEKSNEAIIKTDRDLKNDFSEVNRILNKVDKVVKNGEKATRLTEKDSQDEEIDSDDDADKSATADIWVRTIESPVRKSVKDLALAIESVETKTIEEKLDVEKKKSKHKKEDDDQPDFNDKPYGVTQSQSSNQLSLPPNQRQNQRLVGCESLPCSRPGSRTASRSSSPAFFVNDKTARDKKISAAEALGVVAKPCPRIIPSSNTAFAKANFEFRRQSLGNLSDSKFGRISSGWSSHVPSSASTDVESSYGSDVFDNRRKRLSKRCSSVDSRTLSRCYPDKHAGHFGSDNRGFHTLSKISLRNGTGHPDCKYFPKSTVVPSGYYSLDTPPPPPPPEHHRRSSSHGSKSENGPRPRSTCNCGHHLASLCVPVGKRTYSVEELPSSLSRHGGVPPPPSTAPHPPPALVDLSRSNRSSFGKSQQRVKFALDETDLEKMGSYTSKCVVGSEPEGIMKRSSRKMTQFDDLSNNHGDPNGILNLPPPPPPPYHSVGTLTQGGKLPSSTNSILKQPKPRANNIFGNVPHDSPANPNPPPPLSSSCRRSLPQTALSETATGVSLDSSCSTDLPIPSGVSEYDNALVFRDNILISGPLDALIQHLVPTTEYYPERSYVFAFLLSSRLFIRPHELLGQVIALCDAQQKLGDKQVSSKERLAKFIPRLVQLLAQWSETFPYDFRDERVMAHVRAITHRCVSVEAGVRHQVSSLLTNLLHRLTALEKYEEFLQKINDESSTNSIESLSSTDVIEMCPNAAELAQQLTHIELERLSFIGPEEFVQAFAKENPHVEPSLKEMKKTRNLEAYVQWFNRLSYFVATHICKHQKKKQRVRAVEYWIETARECFNIGNFNSLMAIIAGLNMSPISRLKKTWNKVQSAKFSVLEHQMDPSSNFSSYRSTLKAAMWRSAGATDLRQRIVIPFFSLLVKDLYFLNEGCSNKLRNGHINFKKFWELAKQVTEFISWKQVACPFEKNHKLIAFLQASPVLSENALALASFECEPPENNHEKERFKALKSGGAAS